MIVVTVMKHKLKINELIEYSLTRLNDPSIETFSRILFIPMVSVSRLFRA